MPIAVVPGVGWRFLRQKWNRPSWMSNAAPSGFIANTIQISRVSTIDVIRAFDPVSVGEPVEDVQGHLEAHVLVGVRGTPSYRTSGSSSSTPTLSLTFAAHSWRPL